MVLSQVKVRHVGQVRTARSWGRGCEWARTAPGVGRGCGSGNSSCCWGKKPFVMPSSPAGRTVLSCCLVRWLVGCAKPPSGRAPDQGPGARAQGCPAESVCCSWNAPLLMDGCLTNRRMAGHHEMRTPLPHHRRHRYRHHPQTPPHRKTDVPPVLLSHTHVHHFLLSPHSLARPGMIQILPLPGIFSHEPLTSCV